MMTEPNAVFWGLFRSLLFSYSLLNFTSSQLLYSLVNFESKFIVIIVLNCVAIKKKSLFLVLFDITARTCLNTIIKTQERATSAYRTEQHAIVKLYFD